MKTLARPTTSRIGTSPVVILPLADWEAMQEQLEELEISTSKTLARRIAKARKETKSYTSQEVRKLLVC